VRYLHYPILPIFESVAAFVEKDRINGVSVEKATLEKGF